MSTALVLAALALAVDVLLTIKHLPPGFVCVGPLLPGSSPTNYPSSYAPSTSVILRSAAQGNELKLVTCMMTDNVCRVGPFLSGLPPLYEGAQAQDQCVDVSTGSDSVSMLWFGHVHDD
ncbi:hypothetical protein N7508_004754 [Penicillium antarcticum]|uniref:uncharacterized protein n=1 Tax=Penicillium antarcticum TaxID=416450 RepID=UPI0023A53DCD|nr:uncharacterized protein N7508_004754 [Penicillium antarcticum]KAJ5305739.1 hypothetical protein N7508_004754 [Penicillium antarcticum]